MLTRALAGEVLKKALSTGGDFAEIYMEDNLSSNLSWLDGRVENALSARTHGAGIRVFLHFFETYAYTNDTSRAGLLLCAEKAAQALSATAKRAKTPYLVGSSIGNAHPADILPFYVPGERKAELLMRACNAARSVSPEIRQVAARVLDGDKTVWIANSEGVFTQDRRVRTRFVVSAVAASGSENQDGMEGPGALMGFEFLEGLDIEKLAKKAAKTAITMLHAPHCPAGVMPVAIESGFGGVIFHEACGHALEATSVAKGASVFCGKLGQKIAADCVSAVDDGTMPGAWGSINIDDEGMPGRRNLLIENGVLRSYLIDKLNARRMDMAPTGSARRESYRYAPTSRMTNTYICAGKDADSEIIGSMAEGLYCKQMGGGSVDSVTGEFNFAVREGYLVKNGQIDRPVRGATLIGKGAEVLMRIDRVGKKVVEGQGMCGSKSGSLPTNVGQPLIRVSSMIVGGRKEG